MIRTSIIVLLVLSVAPIVGEHATPRNLQAKPYEQWQNGPSTEADYFPIAVWLQQPKNAERFKAAGINLYIGLWKGPTEKQLAELKKADMPVICAQNAVGLKHVNDKTIVGWMHGDEPDNAQRKPKGQKGWGPPIKPEAIIRDYQKIKKADPSRPVLLNLGQGVAHDNYIGRGVRRGHMEDYPQYVKGCDVISFDIYPVVHRRSYIAGKLEYVPKGVMRLRKWAEDKKIIWNCIECTRISNVKVKPTPHQVRCEVWMSIIHGSRGLIYFVHQFKPKFIESALLVDDEMLKAVTKINRRIHSLAAVINSPSVDGLVEVTSSAADVPVKIMTKKYGGAVYVFAVAMRDKAVTATFRIKDVKQGASAEVFDEGRTVAVKNGSFSDRFKGYDVHLYRIK